MDELTYPNISSTTQRGLALCSLCPLWLQFLGNCFFFRDLTSVGVIVQSDFELGSTEAGSTLPLWVDSCVERLAAATFDLRTPQSPIPNPQSPMSDP